MTEQYKANGHNLTIKIMVDHSPENPREFSPLGTLLCAHRRYSLGDKPVNLDPREIESRAKLAIRSGGIALPVYMYDHSGLALSTRPFSCPLIPGKSG